MQRTLADKNTSDALSVKATAFVARAIASDGRYADGVIDGMEARKLGRFVTKDAILTGEADPLVSGLVAAFLAHTDRQSILGQIPGAMRLPLTAIARTTIGTLEAEETDEGATKAVAYLSFNSINPPLRKVQAGVVVSEDFFRATDRATVDGLRDLLTAATAEKTDAALVEVLTAGGAAGASTPAELVGLLSDGAPREPVLIGSLSDLLSLPDATLNAFDRLGIRLLPTPAAAGKLIALDGPGLLVSDAGVEVATATHATLDLPGSPEGSTVSLWQANLACLRAERFLRLAVRAGAAAWIAVGSPS
jgi:hypothetical protein